MTEQEMQRRQQYQHELTSKDKSREKLIDRIDQIAREFCKKCDKCEECETFACQYEIQAIAAALPAIVEEFFEVDHDKLFGEMYRLLPLYTNHLRGFAEAIAEAKDLIKLKED